MVEVGERLAAAPADARVLSIHRSRWSTSTAPPPVPAPAAAATIAPLITPPTTVVTKRRRRRSRQRSFGGGLNDGRLRGTCTGIGRVGGRPMGMPDGAGGVVGSTPSMLDAPSGALRDAVSARALTWCWEVVNISMVITLDADAGQGVDQLSPPSGDAAARLRTDPVAAVSGHCLSSPFGHGLGVDCGWRGRWPRRRPPKVETDER